MPKNKIEKCIKSIPRVFNLQVEFPPYHTQIAWDVINAIENDQLMVFDAHDADALNDTLERDGSIKLYKRATIPISIKEWLCVSLQVMRWDIDIEFKDPNHCAVYRQNAPDVIYPIFDSTLLPPGPAAFYGQIIVRAEMFQLAQHSVGSFSFVLAHELTHAIDMMRMLVPAFQDWPAFWENVLQEGCRCEFARLLQHYGSIFVDDYGSKNELATVAQYWPSHAEKWFNAFGRGPRKTKSQ